MAMGVGLMQILRGSKVISAIDHEDQVDKAFQEAQLRFENKSGFADEANS
jgi:hypothetical protein